MANGRFRYYYWSIRTLITEQNEIVGLERYSSEDDAIYSGRLDFRLVFNDGSRFIAITVLDENGQIIEHTYYYCYKNANGIRVFSYDDRDHHDVETAPHHMHIGATPEGNEEDTALPSDLIPVSFFTVFQKICDRFQS